MSDFISELKAAWMGNRQREYSRATRGIMTPEDRRALEKEFDRQLAEHDREVSAQAWDEGFAHSVRTNFHSRMPRMEDNPYRKRDINE